MMMFFLFVLSTYSYFMHFILFRTIVNLQFDDVPSTLYIYSFVLFTFFFRTLTSFVVDDATLV